MTLDSNKPESLIDEISQLKDAEKFLKENEHIYSTWSQSIRDQINKANEQLKQEKASQKVKD